MVEVELNNGKVIKGQLKDANNYHDRHESYKEVLLRILDEASNKVGYIPTFEEAKNNPWMPKDLDLYDKYCGSYIKAVRVVSRRRSARQKWRKATEDELKDLRARENKHHVSDVFRLPFSRPTNDQRATISKKDEKGENEMNNKTWDEIRKERHLQVTEDCRRVLREFAQENLRWPTDAEITRFSQKGVPGWSSKAVFRSRFGIKTDWADKIFPEGLPEGFNEANVNRVQKSRTEIEAGISKMEDGLPTSETGVEPSPQVIDSSTMIRKIFLDAASKISEVVGGASKANIELAVSVQIEENEPIKLNFSDTH